MSETGLSKDWVEGKWRHLWQGEKWRTLRSRGSFEIWVFKKWEALLLEGGDGGSGQCTGPILKSFTVSGKQIKAIPTSRIHGNSSNEAQKQTSGHDGVQTSWRVGGSKGKQWVAYRQGTPGLSSVTVLPVPALAVQDKYSPFGGRRERMISKVTPSTKGLCAKNRRLAQEKSQKVGVPMQTNM
jgi:hypothetical protein